MAGSLPPPLDAPASPWQIQADRYAYFTASNPTPGTGLATIAAATTETDTSPFIQINAGAKAVYLDYLILTVTAPGTSGGSIRCSFRTDQLKAAPTGGTQLTPACSRRIFSPSAPVVAPVASLCSVWAGPLVAAAAVAPVRHFQRQIRPVIPFAGDCYVIKFGASDYGVGSLARNGALIADCYVPGPPVAIDPNMTGQFHLWLPSQSAASSYELELGLAEF